jgi:uncharacterized protein YecE (DUF72 family)
MKALIGTSGYHYDVWMGKFYPSRLSRDELLSYYSKHFDTLEVNLTFYKLPDEDVIRDWRKKVPPGFRFSIKANRYITHMKNLKDTGDEVERSLDHFKELGEKLGPILFQLSERWQVDQDRLRNFVNNLPEDQLFVLEPRHPSWFREEIYQILENRDIALCIQDISGDFSPIINTADFIYLRFHGPGGEYQLSYEKDTLAEWAERIRNWLNEGFPVYGYFNNTDQGHAPGDAQKLLGLLENN